MALTAHPGYRVIPHPPLCPDCGSGDITTAEVDTTDGLREAAHICTVCGAAWPVACIAEQLPLADGQARP
ncbi:MAG TPA: hypothetical protein VKS82_14365 [Streptosporangiaceae bacterium]|nr:hypothetical protein [Streptosporangiaceae bacterium]